MTRRFPPVTLARFEATKYLYIRAGDHRFIPIWVVVVDGRVIVRSWNDKASGWYRAFLSQPRGAVWPHDKLSFRAFTNGETGSKTHVTAITSTV